MLVLLTIPFVLLAGVVSARLPDGRLHANIAPHPVMTPLSPITNFTRHAVTDAELPPLNTTYYFDQPIDHNDPSLGTFTQRYWMDWEYYEPGGPILMFTPGENNADSYSGYLTNISIFGMIAQQEKGATVLIEHRFFGFSNPYPDLTTKSLKYLTIQHALDDFAYFAQNAKLPMPGGDNVTPDKVPWVLLGGSYSGALPSFIRVNKPDVFWAGYASSGVVQGTVDFWRYFDIIRQFMPQNCSADVQAVVKHFDDTYASKNNSAMNRLKEMFGMSQVTHFDDVAGALRNNLWDWQKLSPLAGPGAQFYLFCDALEVDNGRIASADGFGLEHAIAAWGAYFKNTYMHMLCGDKDAEACFGSYNASQPYWTDTSVNNVERSWLWLVCNELGGFQEGAPDDSLTIVSRLIRPDYDERQCEMMFPEAFSSPPVPNVQKLNRAYDGWNVQAGRIFFANGKRDPWRDMTVSADQHTVVSTESQPIVVSEGFHFSDLRAAAGYVDPTVANVQKQALLYMHRWMEEFRSSH